MRAWQPHLEVSEGFSSVQFSCSVVSDSLRPHELQHARPPCPSPSTGVHSNSRPSTWWCHPTISLSVVPFSSCLHCFPASGSFLMSQLFALVVKVLGISFSISIYSRYSGLISFRMDWLDLLAVQGTLESLLQHYSSKALILQCSAFFIVQLSQSYTTTGKIFVGKVMSLLLHMLPRLVMAFLPWSKHLIIMAAVTISSDFGPQENKVCHCLHCFPIYLPWSDRIGCHDLRFSNVEF